MQNSRVLSVRYPTHVSLLAVLRRRSVNEFASTSTVSNHPSGVMVLVMAVLVMVVNGRRK
jgi:hypothetical protein